jgi:hypothetical protein
MGESYNQEQLIPALLEGAFETPLWTTFLRRLRQQTAADTATLIFRPPGRPLHEALHLFCGDVEPAHVNAVYRKYLSSLDLLSDFHMDEGRPYTFDDLYPPRNPAHNAFFQQVVIPSGITTALSTRVTEVTGVSAWLTVSRRKTQFGERDSALLRDIGPALRGALRNYVALERSRFTATVTSRAMRKLHFGWMSLDARGRVLEFEPEAGIVLERSKAL